MELKTAEEKAQDAEAEVTNCNKKILVMEQDLDIVTEKLNSSITKVSYPNWKAILVYYSSMMLKNWPMNLNEEEKLSKQEQQKMKKDSKNKNNHYARQKPLLKKLIKSMSHTWVIQYA